MRSVSGLLALAVAVLGQAQETRPRLRSFGEGPPWAKQSWMLRRQIDRALALRGGNVIDVRTGSVLENATVIVRGDRIESIGADSPGEDVDVFDVAGHYLIPGLFDLHAHVIPPSMFMPEAKPPEEALQALIEHGVTMIRLLPFYTESAADWGGRIGVDSMIGPTIVASSGIYELRAQRTSLGFGDPETAREWVLKDALLGARWIKVYNSMDEPSLQAIVETARGFGMRVCGHTERVPPLRAAELGIGSIEHVISIPLSCMREGSASESEKDLGTRTVRRWASVDEEKLAELLAALKRHGTAWVPTLAVTESMLSSGEHDGRAFASPISEEERLETLRKAAQAAVRFHREGGLLGLGTDFPVDGVPVGESVHREMELLVEHGGATPLEALQVATLASARVLGFEELVGTIEPGRIANLVVLRENPLEKISATRTIAYVIHEGRIRVQPDPPGKTDGKK